MADASSGARLRAVPWWRFSLKQLLLATALVAVGCVALRSANTTWVGVMFGLTWLALAASLLLALYRDGPSRAFWVGFAALGWLYLLLLMYCWNLPEGVYRWGTPLRSDELITTRLSHKLHGWMYPVPTGSQPVYPGASASGGMPMGSGGANMNDGMSGYGGSMGSSDGGMSGGDMMAGSGGGMPGGFFGGMPGGMPGPVVPAFSGPSQQDFTNVSHALWTLLLAFCGGWFAQWLYATRGQRSTAGNSRQA